MLSDRGGPISPSQNVLDDKVHQHPMALSAVRQPRAATVHLKAVQFYPSSVF